MMTYKACMRSYGSFVYTRTCRISSSTVGPQSYKYSNTLKAQAYATQVQEAFGGYRMLSTASKSDLQHLDQLFRNPQGPSTHIRSIFPKPLLRLLSNIETIYMPYMLVLWTLRGMACVDANKAPVGLQASPAWHQASAWLQIRL